MDTVTNSNLPGIEVRGKSIRVVFMYKGIRHHQPERAQRRLDVREGLHPLDRFSAPREQERILKGMKYSCEFPQPAK